MGLAGLAGLANAGRSSSPRPPPPPIAGLTIQTVDDLPFTRRPQYAGLTSAVDIASRQRLANVAEDRKLARSSMRGLTIRTALQDIREVLVGIPQDLRAGRTMGLADLLLKNDRLRGVGLIMMLVGLAALVL